MHHPESWEDPRRCVLIIVDVQNDFCHEEGAIAKLGQDTSLVRSILPNIKALIEVGRTTGIPRIYARVVHNQWFDTPAWRGRGRAGTTLDIEKVPVAKEGSWGAEFYELSPQTDELVLTKHRYSAFAYTPLELAIRGKERDTVVLAGTQTNACVMATANDAIFKSFYPVVVADCTASGSSELHAAALTDFAERLGAVVTLEDVRQAWKAPAMEPPMTDERSIPPRLERTI